jgi:hypothetical protein
MDDRDALQNLAQELFGDMAAPNIPPAYMRELKRYLDTATASLVVVVNSNERRAYWLDGRSLGVLGCTGVSDMDVADIGGKILQLDHVTTVDVTIAVHYDNGLGRVTDSGRRLTIGHRDKPDVVLDASPGRSLPEKRAQIEHFIDQLLAALAGRVSP